MNLCKKVEIMATAVALLPQDMVSLFERSMAGESLSEKEQSELNGSIEKIKEEFGIDDIKEIIELSITLEDFIFGLFSQVPKPESPLRIASYNRWLSGIAESLVSTLNKENELPNISKEDLGKVRHYIEDDAEFQKQSALFSFTNKKTGKTSSLALSAMILASNHDFVSVLDILFNS